MMPEPNNPFLDPALVRGDLYAAPRRLSARTSALLAARVAGTPVTEVLTDLTRHVLGAAAGRSHVLDIGCGRGTSTLALASEVQPAHMTAFDAAHALLDTTRCRLRQAGVRRPRISVVAGDFHRMPFPDATFDVAVAAFCLYHSPRPTEALIETRRCLRPGGAVIIATKSADSYAELDQLVAIAGLDVDAVSRPSLYQTLNSDNISLIAGGVFAVQDIRHEEHRFRFRDLAHTAAYLATSPKYRLATGFAGNPTAVADALRRRLPDQPIRATSTVSYAVGTHDVP
jgi:SAM-dependent methyltransferase